MQNRQCSEPPLAVTGAPRIKAPSLVFGGREGPTSVHGVGKFGEK